MLRVRLPPDSEAVRPGALFQRFTDTFCRQAQCGQKSGKNSGDERDAKGEGQYPPVKANGVGARQLIADKLHHEHGCVMREDQAERATGNRQDHRLRKHLLQEAATAGSESRADGDFFAPRKRIGQHQIRDVGTGDQEHQGDRAQQNEQPRTNIADQIIAQRNSSCAPAFVVLGILLRQPVGDGRQFGFGLLQRDARFQTGNHTIIVVVANGAISAVQFCGFHICG